MTSWTNSAGVWRFVSDGAGNSAAVLGIGIGSIFQDFQLSDDGDYSISLDTFMESPGGLEDPTSVGLGLSLINPATSQTIFSETFVETHDGAISSRSFNFSVSSANVNTNLRLALRRTGTEKALAFADNVEISASPVPEPSSVLLSLCASLIVMRRKRS